MSKLEAQILNRHEKREQLNEMILALAEQVGAVYYPGVVGKALVVYTDINNIDWSKVYRCTGYEADRNGEVIMTLEDSLGEHFCYDRQSLIRYTILEDE